MNPSTKPIDHQPSSQSLLARLFSLSALDWYIEIVLLLAIGLTPLIISPLTSELFEFPKMVFVYILAIVGLVLISLKALQAKQLPLVNTPLNKPILLFVFTFVISTILSIDVYTSIVGYYSRFNGGLTSLIAYLILFYITLVYLITNNSTQPSTSSLQSPISDLQHKIQKILCSWLISSAIVSVWGIMEHFGYDPSCYILNGTLSADCWVQDVQARVFSTFGQPNWLASYSVATIPLGITFLIFNHKTWQRRVAWLIVALNYAAFWYTYSRSGWIGLAVAIAILMPFIIKYIHRQRLWTWIVTLGIACLVISLSGISMATQRTATSLESGDFDSSTGQIRLLVWQGSIETWGQYPIFGSGPETFAYSFLAHRPAELNQTTEWNFLYNKAHNEILNTAVTLGLVGLSAWLFLYLNLAQIIWDAYRDVNRRLQSRSYFLIQIALFSGIIGVFTSQLLGFSVVVTSLLFWLAAAIIIAPHAALRHYSLSHSYLRKIIVGSLLFLTIATGWATARYFMAEIAANRGASSSNFMAAHRYRQAISFNPYESEYHQQLSYVYAYMAQFGGSQSQQQYLQQSVDQAIIAQQLNPHNILNLKGLTYTYRQLGQVNPKYQQETIRVAQAAVSLDATDAVAQQILAQAYLDANQPKSALSTYNTIIGLRPNAALSFQLRSQYYQKYGLLDKAITDLQHALTLEPNNQQVAKELRNIQEN